MTTKQIIKPLVFGAVIGAIVMIILHMADAPYRAKVANFTDVCHKSKGVVIEEHGTRNLLCFPSDA